MKTTKPHHATAGIIIAALAMLLTPRLLPAQENVPPPQPAAAETIYSLRDVDTPPKVKGTRTTPAMPSKPRKLGINGSATVRFIVGTNGNVEKAEATQWSDKSTVDAAIAAIMLWHFSPAQKNGVPVKCRLSAPIESSTEGGVFWKEAPVSPDDFDTLPTPTDSKAYPKFPAPWKSKPNKTTLTFLIGENGKVSQIKTVSSTDAAFSKTLETTAATWLYTPAKHDGKVVPCPMTLTVQTTPPQGDEDSPKSKKRARSKKGAG